MKFSQCTIGLGVSVYLREYLENPLLAEQYLDKAVNHGFHEVFTSIHLPEDDFIKTVAAVKEFSELVFSKEMDLTIDCSRREFKRIIEDPILKKEINCSHITYLRLDFGFQEDDLVSAFNDLNIHGFVLNASTMREIEIEKMMTAFHSISNDLMIKACHNFYPRPETGLGLDFFVKQSACFKKFGIPVVSCVASQNNPRGPLHLGLPTLENHRNVSIQWAARELIATGVVDEILIGDPFASEEELEALQRAVISPILVLRIMEDEDLLDVERKILYGNSHVVRPDLSDLVLRSNTSREMAAMGEKLMARPSHQRVPYSITIDNEKYGRYSGELQIVRKELPADERVNVVGRIIPQDVCLLRYIEAGAEFVFWKYDESKD